MFQRLFFDTWKLSWVNSRQVSAVRGYSISLKLTDTENLQNSRVIYVLYLTDQFLSRVRKKSFLHHLNPS